jgi:hypothetical protein
VTQPALSQQVQKLEVSLGVPLFERRGRSVRLTRAGERLLPQARSLLRPAADVQQSLAECKRAYPEHYLLALHARHRGKLLDLDRVIEEMTKIRSPFLEVWVIASIGPNHLKVVRVAPSGPALDLKLGIDLGNASRLEMSLNNCDLSSWEFMFVLQSVFLEPPSMRFQSTKRERSE